MGRFGLLLLLAVYATLSAATHVVSTPEKTEELLTEELASTSCKYVRLHTWLKWKGARAACQKEGGDLASFHSASEWRRGVAVCAHHTCYIGMVKDNEDSTSRSDWRWSDGSAVDYQNWDSHGEGKKSGETKTAIFREDKGWHDWGKGWKELQPLCGIGPGCGKKAPAPAPKFYAKKPSCIPPPNADCATKQCMPLTAPPQQPVLQSGGRNGAKCFTFGGNARLHSLCKFPFVYKGKTYNDCIINKNGGSWCFTNKKLTKWGHCKCGVRKCKYFRVKKWVTWNKARRECRKAKGDDLASIHSADEWGKAVQKCNHHTCHIGLYRGRHRSKRSDWRWSDRTPVDYQNWNSYREGRHTGETRSAIFRSDKGWHDWGTGIEQLQPLCEKCHIHETYKPAPKNNPKPKPKPVVAGIVFSTDVKFVGCFKDTASHPGKHGPLKYGYNSETCKQACKKYDYFSLQDWGFCSCFNEKIWPDIVDLQVSDEKCGKVCPCEEKAVPMRRCGEKWLNAVYTTKDITHHMGLSWSYHGKHDGRKTWCSRYNKKLGTGNCCGYEQSPVNVDLRNVSKGNTSDLVTHFAGLQEAEMYHAGHTLALNGKAMWKDAITFEGEKFHLMNITFHQASETSIDGTPYGFEAQMLFKNRRGDGVISEWGDKMVIITTLFQIGKPNPYLKKLKWDQLPKEKCSKVDLGKIDPIGLVPTMKLFTSGAQKKMSKVPEMSYYQYEGSLSIPPCTEGVQWLVLTHPNTISKEQLAQFPLKDNVRKIQPLNGRVIEYLDGAYGSGDVGMQFKGAVESWKSSHTAKMKSKIVDRINHFSPKHHQIDASKVTLKIGAGSIVVNMHVEDVSLQALTKFKNEIKNGLFNPMDGEFKSEVAKMGGFKVKKYIKRKRSKSSLKKAPAPIAIKVKVPPSTEFPTSPPVAPVKLVDPWVLCAHVPHHSVILLSLGGDMKLFTGTTIFLTQLQLHLQDLLRIGPQDLEIFVKPNKVLQVEVTLFNDAAGALAVALVRHWQAGNFHPFQNFPVNVLQVLGSPACTVNNTLVQTAVPTTAQPTEVPTTAAPTTATPTPAPTEGPTQPPVVHVVPKIKVKVPATTAPSAVPSAAPSEGPTQAPVMHAPAGPAPVVVNLKMPAAAQQKPVIASDSTDLQKQLDQLKDSLLKELDVKLRTISQTKGSELLKAELKHYINKKVSLLKAEHVQTHASVAELRASMIESLKVLLKHAIEGFHAGEAVATATKPSVHVTHNIVQPNVHVTNHVTHNVVVTPNVQVTHNIHVTHNIVVKHNAAAAANAAQTVVAHNAAAAARAVHKGAATLAPTATALPTVVPVVQKYHAEADGFKSNIDAMMRLRDRAIKYHSQPMNGRNVHGTSDHKPQFGRPMSTPRKHCSPYDHWNVDSFC